MINIDISDTGPGIPEEIKERIFEPFFTTNKNGTGLGLAITKRIVSAHNGQIKVDSFPGGTVFRITLPIDQ
jgi:signal transduction histidine kinase